MLMDTLGRKYTKLSQISLKFHYFKEQELVNKELFTWILTCLNYKETGNNRFESGSHKKIINSNPLFRQIRTLKPNQAEEIVQCLKAS